MWIKFLCWWFGHQTVHKAATGKQFAMVNQLTGQPDVGNYYRWERTPFCTRCGKMVWEEKEKGSDEKVSTPDVL